MSILKKHKGQGSIEFVILGGVMFFVIIGMTTVIQVRLGGVYKDRLYNSMEALGNVINTEIRLARAASSDYSREFFLPFEVGDYNYSLTMYDKSEVVIQTGEIDYVLFLDVNVSGDIGKGRNIISKQNDDITITYIPPIP
jgi:hypothetical protein